MRITNEDLIQIIKEELEAVIDEKKGKKRKAAKKKRRKKKKAKKKAKRDACYHKVRSRYDVWPSAYASGALVKCRKVGAKNWGNSTKEGLDEASQDDFDKYADDDFKQWYALLQKYMAADIGTGRFDTKKERNDAYKAYVAGYTADGYKKAWLASKSRLEEFKPHDMYDPETGEKHKAKKKEDHVDMAGKGFVHVDPDELRDILDDEGGAAGLEPLVKGTESEEEEVEKALDQMPDVGKHEKGDYIKGDKKKIRIVKEAKNCGCGKNPCKTYGRQ